MKKKYIVPSKEKEEWINFTKEIGDIESKDDDILKQKTKITTIPQLDLHGFSLVEANKVTKKFIIESFNKGYKKLIIITGKGTRSKSYDNPYLSEKLSMLKYSVPEYINRDKSLINKISKISKASLEDGGEGSFYIFLKKYSKIKE